MNRKVAGWIGIALFVALVLYPFSYAPYIRFRYGPSQATNEDVQFDLDAAYFKNREHTAYAPVEWMIDETPLEKPLVAWAELCGADDKVTRDSIGRQYDRLVQQDRESR